MKVLDYHVSFGDSRKNPDLVNKPKQIIIHCMGQYIIDKDGVRWSAHKWLEKLRISAHRIVWTEDHIIKMRSDFERAYHAKGHNTDTLGMEFVVEGEFRNLEELNERIKEPYLTDYQYDAGLWQVRDWMKKHNIEQLNDNITTHVKLSPERRQDPGVGFPEQFFYDL